ncbi:hypothetical protein GCM10009599_12030 [Luteococcus peritonei]
MFHATLSAAAMRDTDKWLTTSASNAHRNAPFDRHERGFAAQVRSWRQMYPQPVHW